MKILIPIIVGAIIGYFTNWLAIKMLFRPHYEKRIFGLKLPFTPGLIPKEKDRIARNIGETVGQHLLSAKTIIKALEKREMEVKIKSKIKKGLRGLKENHKPLDNYMKKLLKENYTLYKGKLESFLTRMIVKEIRKDGSKDLIYKEITKEIDSFQIEDLYGRLEKNLKASLIDLKESSEFIGETNRIISDKLILLSKDERKIKELIPGELSSFIVKYIEESQDEISFFVRRTFMEPVFQAKIKNSIRSAVAQNVSRLITAFVDPDIIADKIFHIIEKYIYSQDTDRYLVEFSKSAYEGFLDSKSSDLISKLYKNLEDEDLERFTKLLIKTLVKEENISYLLDNLGSILENKEEEYKEEFTSYLIESIGQYLDSQDIVVLLDETVKELVNRLLENPLSAYFGQVNEEKIEKVYFLGKDIFDNFATNHLAGLIEEFNISKIVEEEIQGFDVDFTEKLILDIAQKELRAITRLGALLGGIMGLLTPLFQALY